MLNIDIDSVQLVRDSVWIGWGTRGAFGYRDVVSLDIVQFNALLTEHGILRAKVAEGGEE